MQDQAAAAPTPPPDPPDPRGGKERESFPSLPNPINLYDPSNQLNGVRTNHFTRYLQVEFENTDRKSVSPFQIQNDIKARTGHKPEELTGTGKSRYTIKTNNAKQTEICLKIKELAGKKCTITPHPKFNSCQGLIYTRDYNYQTEDLQNGLEEEFGVSQVQKADFIKTRDGVTPYILSFNREETPYAVSIPGERSDCVVNPFRSKPMMCKKCLVYGHTQKRCKKDTTHCKKCAEEGHDLKDCQAQTEKCFHCKESHQAGSKNCPVQLKEEKILQIVETKKVTFQRARQIMENKPVHRTVSAKTPSIITKFDIKWPKGTKRNTSPFEAQREIEKHIGKKLRSMRSKANDEDTVTVEVSTQAEAFKLNTLTRIGEYNVGVFASDAANLPRGIIFIDSYDQADSEDYRNELINQHNLVKAEHAHWIRSRNPALLITFQRELPEYLDIPGESKRTAVLEYKRQPNLCGNCLIYGHPKKVCRDRARCQNCTSIDHPTSQCDQESKCLQCHLNHRTGSKNCQAYKVEEEIAAIQEKSAVSRSQAWVIHRQEHQQNSAMNYAATLNTNNPNNKPAKPSSSGANGVKKKIPKTQLNPNNAETTPTTTEPAANKSTNKFNALASIENYDSSNEDECDKTFEPQMLTEDEKNSRNCPEIYLEVKKIWKEYVPPKEPEHGNRPSRPREPDESAKRRISSESGENRHQKARKSVESRISSEVRPGRSGNDYSKQPEHNSRSRSPLKSQAEKSKEKKHKEQEEKLRRKQEEEKRRKEQEKKKSRRK